MINVKFKNIPKLYTTPKPISKLLKIFLEITLLVFSLDFGFYKYKSRLAKIVIVSILAFSTLLSISTFVSYLPNISHFTMLWHIKTLVLNHINILVLFIIPENKSFYIFLNHLHYRCETWCWQQFLSIRHQNPYIFRCNSIVQDYNFMYLLFSLYGMSGSFLV